MPQAVPIERDLRLDLFRGLALWFIFIDHIPDNFASWITVRTYGFSDASEIFVFISGYTAAFVYGRVMRNRGVVLASASILRRVGQIYLAHIFLFTIFMAEIAHVSRSFENPLYAEEMNILDFLQTPDVTVVQALLLKFTPVYMDILPLYIVLLALFPLGLVGAATGGDLHAGDVRVALRTDVVVRLECSGLSWRVLVLQSIRLAAVVRVRRLVRARRCRAAAGALAIPLGPRPVGPLRIGIVADRPGLANSAHRRLSAGLADRQGGLSRQDQSRYRAADSLHRADGAGGAPAAGGLEGLAVMDFPARDPDRAAFARDLLRRCRSLVSRTLPDRRA